MRSSSAIAFLMLCSGPRLAAQTPAPVSTTPKLSGYVQARFQSIGDSAVFSLRRVRLGAQRSEEHTSELQSQSNLVCRLLLEKKKNKCTRYHPPHDHTIL